MKANILWFIQGLMLLIIFFIFTCILTEFLEDTEEKINRIMQTNRIKPFDTIINAKNTAKNEKQTKSEPKQESKQEPHQKQEQEYKIENNQQLKIEDHE